MKLTELSVRRLSKPGIYWDSLLPAFGLRIGVRAKTWIVSIRRPGARNPSRLKIGTFPELSLAAARAQARKMMTGGILPPSGVPKMGFLVEQFLEHGRTRSGRPIRPATKRAYKSVLLSAARPLHHRTITDIRRRDIATLLADINRQTGPSNASLTRAALARFWSWLGETDQADANPVISAPRYEIPKRDRVLADFEMHRIWAETGGQEDFALILRIMLWTGCRRIEAGGMQWQELVDGQWRIPPERVKNRRALILPLARQTRDALDRWPRIVGRAYLFGRGPAGFNSFNLAKARLDQRLRFNRPWQLRDTRRTVETKLAEIGIAKETRSRILNHDVGELEARYNVHAYLTEKRAALELWADHLESIVAAECANPIGMKFPEGK
jgi:integrase